ncbi:MAG: DUF1549 domain-containing protein [Verrucomicrobia bacterium]|nr:DUF1549 domain-containing protein [Verrucomicrobiota bacterium]
MTKFAPALVALALCARVCLDPATASGASPAREFHFVNDIEPLLSRYGCNSSGCHGKAEGQNGFKLSVFGFDPKGDHAALVREGRGRRVSPAAPDTSLFLLKAAGIVPHGGGGRIAQGTSEFQLIRDWIAAGAPFGRADAPRVARIEIAPRERVLGMGATQQLRVTANYSDGSTKDVTRLALFHSNNEGLVRVDDDGQLTTGSIPGQAAVMARFGEEVDVFRAMVPRGTALKEFTAPPQVNFIDALVDAQLKKLNVLPSGLADDPEFLRRVYLDVIGTLPTPAEARRFLADARTDKRARLVEALLDRPEFADYWALKWADVLQVDRLKLQPREAYAYFKWIRDSLAANKPLDRVARELLTAEGPLDDAPAGHFYKVATKPGDMANSISQSFLGVRIACAECHHHPYDRWSQADYQGMAAFFTQVSVRKGALGDALLAEGNPQARHPRTGEPIHPYALGATMPGKAPEGDRRRVLSDWFTSSDNPWFARNLANRLVAHFFGRGLVEPVDDVRATNPASNPELLDALARDVQGASFDFKKIIRTLTASRTYQLSSKPNATNERDEQNYSRALFKRLPAEVLFDAVSQTTGVGEKFEGVAPGVRAVQLWDSQVQNYFLKLFGRPSRMSACECDRNTEASIAQVLHLLNSPDIHRKLSHESGTVARLVRTIRDDAALVDELYFTWFSRPPTGSERAIAMQFLKDSPSRRQGAEDLAWSLQNSLEFIFNH